MRSNRGKTYVSSGIILPSKVINLVIKRPFHFCYRPGDYVFINIPAIAKYEWHPFTLSSAPEDSDHIGLHIRAVGEWTNRLLNFFQKEQERLHNGEVLPYEEQNNGKNMEMQEMLKNSYHKVDERNDGKNMRQNMMLSSEVVSDSPMAKCPVEKSASMSAIQFKKERKYVEKIC